MASLRDSYNDFHRVGEMSQNSKTSTRFGSIALKASHEFCSFEFVRNSGV